MLTIRSITADELPAWAALDDRPDAYLARQIRGLVDRGASRPEWLLVAERDGRAVGRLGVVAEPLASVDPTLEFRLLGLTLPRESDALDVGAALVEAAIERAIPAGTHALDFRINPDYQVGSDLRRALAERSGFSLFQEKEGFLWNASAPEPERPRPSRLTFRSIREVGRDVLADIMGRCTSGTLDRVDRHYAATVGQPAWGREILEYLEDEDADSWRLGMTPDGEPAGYVLLSRFDPADRSTIIHIGVLPEQRGRGYVDELLAEYNRIARARGFTSSISDVDVENGPMAAAMERNGHHAAATAWHVFHYRRMVTRA